MQNTVLGAPVITVLHFEWNLLVGSFWRVFFPSHYGSIMCNIHCATDETGSRTGQNGGCPGGLRPVRGQEVIPPCSLVAPKEAVASSSSWHTKGEWLWPLGFGPERKTRSDYQTRALWCEPTRHSWVENLTHWNYDPPPFVPLGSDVSSLCCGRKEDDVMKTQLAEGMLGCCLQSWGAHSLRTWSVCCWTELVKGNF